MVDISKRRQAEENLAASQNRLRTIIDAEPACVKVVSPDGILLEMNAAGLAMFDAQSPEQVVGKPVYSMIHPDDRERFRASHERVCRGEEGTLEFRTVGLRGTERWCEMHAVPLRNEKNEVVAALSVTRDVTERKRAREGLEKLSRQNALILNSAGEGIYGLDIEGKATFVNATAALMLGWTVEELVGQPMHAFLHHTRPDGTPYPLEECPIYAAFKDGAVHHVVDEKFWRKDGTSFPVEYISNPIRENEKVAGAVVTFKDVTEHKKLEDQLRQAQKMEAVGRLAGGVAHDFNNLLTIIGGYSQLLLQRMGPEDPSRSHVTEIKLAGDRAGALTRQLLAFSRRQILTPQVLDLNDVVGNVEKMLRRLIGEDVELATLQAPNLGRVKADPGQIEQVLMNLAVNARDAMPHGGKLTIETANVILDENFGPGPVHVKPGPYVKLKVCDTGCGMTAEVQKHLFEPFFTTKEKGKGTGLGLAMVYGIVKQSGGYIWVDSQPGEGATFTIHLPQVEEVVKAAEPGRTYSALPRGSETVLLVEDEVALRSLVRGILVSTGYNVLEAGHSVDALLISNQHQGPIHLLLTDIVMPGMTGRELAEQLCIFHPNMKVLYVSGYTDDAYVQHGVLKAQAAFLQKPFTPEALARKVRQVLDARRGGAPPASGGVSQ
ncbi:MAG: hybrid sensor histidine kinase/response regulator [Acidobacteria bacterium]|nr:MAG: hybrid sensor histidine kinase/response regulator [Acidobacteriota bacterium]